MKLKYYVIGSEVNVEDSMQRYRYVLQDIAQVLRQTAASPSMRGGPSANLAGITTH